MDNHVLQAIAGSHDVSPATVTLAWHLRQDGLTVIPRTSDIEHLRSNLDSLELDLTDDEISRIDGLGPPLDQPRPRALGLTHASLLPADPLAKT